MASIHLKIIKTRKAPIREAAGFFAAARESAMQMTAAPPIVTPMLQVLAANSLACVSVSSPRAFQADRCLPASRGVRPAAGT
jgi:hypothetical protein